MLAQVKQWIEASCEQQMELFKDTVHRYYVGAYATQYDQMMKISKAEFMSAIINNARDMHAQCVIDLETSRAQLMEAAAKWFEEQQQTLRSAHMHLQANIYVAEMKHKQLQDKVAETE